jgi:HK97 family phage prohead protease
MPTAREVRAKCTFGARILKQQSNGTKGEIDVIANTGYKDLAGDTIPYGAWKNPINELASGKRVPLIFWQHQLEQLPLGSVSKLEELPPWDQRVPEIDGQKTGTAGALKATLRFATDTSRGADAYRLMAGGHVKEVSVQFDMAEDNARPDGAGGRILSKIGSLYEISLVVAGASLGTMPLEVRSALHRVVAPTPKIFPTLSKEALAHIRAAALRCAWLTDWRLDEKATGQTEADKLAVDAVKNRRVLRLSVPQMKMLRAADKDSQAGRLFEYISRQAEAGNEKFRALLWPIGDLGVYL